MPRPFVLDMETSDPDDFITLLLLLGHPEVDLKAVTITPGTRAQVALVRWALAALRREDVQVGAFDIDHPKNCVSEWHYNPYTVPRDGSAGSTRDGWGVLRDTLGPDTTLVTGAPLKNLGRLLHHDKSDRCLGRLFIQGGFAGDGVVLPEKQLEKFRGRTTCPTFNLNGDPQSAVAVLRNRRRFSDLRFVSKNVCHGVAYDHDLHERLTQALRANSCTCTSFAAPGHDSGCNLSGLGVTPVEPRWQQALMLIAHGMGRYLDKNPKGKALHDPLAACCAIDPDIGEWAEVDLYRERGEWGAKPSPGSGVQIITDYDRERFVRTLLAG